MPVFLMKMIWSIKIAKISTQLQPIVWIVNNSPWKFHWLQNAFFIQHPLPTVFNTIQMEPVKIVTPCINMMQWQNYAIKKFLLIFQIATIKMQIIYVFNAKLDIIFLLVNVYNWMHWFCKIVSLIVDWGPIYLVHIVIQHRLL